MRLISRVVGGWNVRMIIAGKRKSRFFADSRFGGKSAARKAAVIYRDQLEARYPIRQTVPRPLIVKRGNTSCYQIRIPKPDGSTSTTEFSVQRHGLRLARQMATQAYANAAKRVG